MHHVYSSLGWKLETRNRNCLSSSAHEAAPATSSMYLLYTGRCCFLQGIGSASAPQRKQQTIKRNLVPALLPKATRPIWLICSPLNLKESKFRHMEKGVCWKILGFSFVKEEGQYRQNVPKFKQCIKNTCDTRASRVDDCVIEV